MNNQTSHSSTAAAHPPALIPNLLAVLAVAFCVAFPFLPMARIMSFEPPNKGHGTLKITTDGYDAKLYDIWFSITFRESGLREYWLVLALVFVAVALCFFRKYHGTLLMAFAATGMSYYALQAMFEPMLRKSQKLIAQVLPVMVASEFGPDARPSWGWLVLLAGLTSLFFSSLIGIRQLPSLSAEERQKQKAARGALISQNAPTGLMLSGAFFLLLFPYAPVARGLLVGGGELSWKLQQLFSVLVSGTGHAYYTPISRNAALPEYKGFIAFTLLTVITYLKKEVRLAICGVAALWVLSAFTLWHAKGNLSGQQAVTDWGWGFLLIGLLLVTMAPAVSFVQSVNQTQESRALARPQTGTCPACGAVNPLSFTKCHACFVVLPWTPIPKVKAPKVKHAASSRPSIGFSPGGLLSYIDWMWWFVAAVSFAMPPVGLLLYLAFTRSDDDKASAAALGGLSAMLLFIARMWWLMYKASQPLTP